METFISISMLNDFIFCPYSIYLHNVYVESDESIYHATPQIKGKTSHTSIDEKSYSCRNSEITSMTVYSDSLQVIGKIDLFKKEQRLLVEKKYRLKKIYKGQLYQLWAQFFCLEEMGYLVEKLAFYEISTNKMYPVDLPGIKERNELIDFIYEFKRFSPETSIMINKSKCTHCIYCNLCDKTSDNNVYE